MSDTTKSLNPIPPLTIEEIQDAANGDSNMLQTTLAGELLIIRQCQAAQGDVVEIIAHIEKMTFEQTDFSERTIIKLLGDINKDAKAAIVAMGDASARKDEGCIGTTAKTSANAITTSPANNSTTIQSDCKLNSSMPQGADLSREICVVDEEMPYPMAIVSEWCGGVENIKESQTYNVTGMHLKQLLLSYTMLCEQAPEPVMVSLEKCVEAMWNVWRHNHMSPEWVKEISWEEVNINADKHALWSEFSQMGRDEAKAVLDAAGVKYSG